MILYVIITVLLSLFTGFLAGVLAERIRITRQTQQTHDLIKRAEQVNEILFNETIVNSGKWKEGMSEHVTFH